MNNKQTAAKRLDLAGMLVSGLCAIHCSVIPIILLFGLGTSLGWMMSHEVEIAFFICSILIASASLIRGYLKVHRQLSVLYIAAFGFLAFIIGHEFMPFALKIVFTSIGGLSILASHYLNFKFQSTSFNLVPKH